MMSSSSEEVLVKDFFSKQALLNNLNYYFYRERDVMGIEFFYITSISKRLYLKIKYKIYIFITYKNAVSKISVMKCSKLIIEIKNISFRLSMRNYYLTMLRKTATSMQG